MLGYPVIESVADETGNDQKNATQGPCSIQPAANFDGCRGSVVGGAIFYKDKRIHLGRIDAILLTNIRTRRGLKRRKTNVAFLVSAQGKIYRTIAKITNAVEQNYRMTFIGHTIKLQQEYCS